MKPLLLLILLCLSYQAAAQNLNANTRTIRFAGVPSGPCTVFFLGVNNSANTEYNCGTDGVWHQIGAAVGSVTSVSFTGGLISVGTPTTTPAFTVAGTSGGIPYFASASTWASSAALAANQPVVGGGAATTPATIPLTFAAQTDGATVTWALASAAFANGSLTFTAHGGSRTLNITGPLNGGSYVLWIKQDATGSEGLTLGTGCTWKVSGGGAGAITPSTAANAVDVLAFTYDGTNCYANFNKNFN